MGHILYNEGGEGEAPGDRVPSLGGSYLLFCFLFLLLAWNLDVGSGLEPQKVSGSQKETSERCP